MNWIKNNLVLIIKIFLGLLLLQFFLQTLVTFGFWFNGNFWTIVWLRKEILIIILSIFVVWFLVKKISKENLEILREEFPLKTFVLIFFVTLIVAFVIAMFNSSLSNYILSVRYSMFGFYIFVLFFVIWYLFFDKKSEDLAMRYNKIIKYILIWSLAWRAMIWLVPSILRHVWYNQWNFEWDVWIRPPAAYYTELSKWFVRNQFLFERPISLWFFLVVFWPLFFMLVLYKKSHKDWVIRWWLYGIILLSTFSRAAWWAWFLQTIIMFLILYWKNWRKLSLYFFGPIILLLWVVSYYGNDQILNRQYSNTWHMKEIQIALQKVWESPFFGKWAASAGPASHHLWKWKEYNPENQYLQIWIEYGLLAFVGWMFLYIYLHMIWFWAWKDWKMVKQTKNMSRLSLIMIAFSIGLFWLSIEWMVLHSFVDRMIVYPFVVLLGLYYAVYYKEKKSLVFK